MLLRELLPLIEPDTFLSLLELCDTGCRKDLVPGGVWVPEKSWRPEDVADLKPYLDWTVAYVGTNRLYPEYGDLWVTLDKGGGDRWTDNGSPA